MYTGEVPYEKDLWMEIAALTMRLPHTRTASTTLKTLHRTTLKERMGVFCIRTGAAIATARRTKSTTRLNEHRTKVTFAAKNPCEELLKGTSEGDIDIAARHLYDTAFIILHQISIVREGQDQ